MREILFRGKRIDNGEWVEGCFIEPNAIFSKDCASGSFGTIKGIKQSIGLDVYLVNPETVGQFTGLTDKNGVKIFEGDILQDKNEYGTLNCFVVYEHHYWRFRGKNVYLNFHSEMLVIGNIHDNPELL